MKLMPRSGVVDTAEAGWRAFKAGKRVVIPRFVDRLILTFAALLPTGVLLRLMSALQRPLR